MDIQDLITFYLATAAVVIVPGPNIMLIISDSILYGVRRSFFTVSGVNAGMLFLFSLSLLGVSAVMVQSPFLFKILKFTGMGYLCYLGIMQLTVSLKPNHSRQNDPEKPCPHSTGPYQSRGRLLRKGFLISATNPKGVIFAGAFFPQFINPDIDLVPQTLALCTGCLIVASVIGMLYALMAKTAKDLFLSLRFQIYTVRISGLFFILYGIGLFWFSSGQLV
ncbi:MAG: LysE family translocator [Desulfobacteraceae bacterium]|nr:MAG: LysE family translocator [Desulfobacteraceae bacterium]